MVQTLKYLQGDVLVVIGTAMFATYPLFLRLFPHISTLCFLLAFQVVGALVFFFLAKTHGFPTLTKKDMLLLTALAFVAVGHDLLYFMAYRTTTVANAAIAHQSVSIFLLFLSPLLLKERVHRDELYALAFALAGVIALYSQGIEMGAMQDFVGVSLGLASGFFFALLIILYRVTPNPDRGLHISVVNFWRYLLSTALLLPFASLLQVHTITTESILPLIGFAVLFAVIASGIHHVGIHKTRPLHASILIKSEPVFAIVFGFMVLKEVPTFAAIIGGILIAGSGIWLALRTRGKL